MTQIHQKNLEQSQPLEEIEKEAEQTDKLLKESTSQTPNEQFLRQRKMAQECCDLGRKYLLDKNYQMAVKELSKTIMTFEYILKNPNNIKNFKADIADLHKNIMVPAYSNLSLGYLKLQNYQMVITCANQVIAVDSGNAKNIYRRGVARKFTKEFDAAIEDLEKVVKLDGTMGEACRGLIQECKKLKEDERKKSKLLAKKLIEGYSEDKPEPVPAPVVEKQVEKKGWITRSLDCVKNLWNKVLRR